MYCTVNIKYEMILGIYNSAAPDQDLLSNHGRSEPESRTYNLAYEVI